MSLTPSDLTLFRVAAEGRCDEELLVLGRDAAHDEAFGLFARPDVLAVTCEPLAWGTAAEDDIIIAGYFNGIDLHSPVAALADEAGVDFDPENFDPVALLGHLRELASAEPVAA